MRSLILGSASPRRRELLGLLGLQFRVISSEVDEDDSSSDPAELVVLLAQRKADAISASLDTNSVSCIIAADTVVALCTDTGYRILGKPKSHTEAVDMLQLLSDRTHEVLTGVTIQWVGASNRSRNHVERTLVTFREISLEMIEFYVSTGEPMDKAGAYGIQGAAAAFVSRIEGDYHNVVGLPLAALARMFEDEGVEWWSEEERKHWV